MLNMEYLLEEAKSNALPIIKKRAIIREYLQIIMLNSIYHHTLGKYLFFMGGTAMRYFYKLPRFSEDIDFNTSRVAYGQFKDIVEMVLADVSKEGFLVKVIYQKRKTLLRADVIFDDVVEKYNISDGRGMNLMVKIEVNNPSWELLAEPAVLSMYGYNFTALLMSKGDLLAEKTCALLNRKRGRDIYDLLFMLQRKFPFNEKTLKANNVKLPVKDAILAYFKKMEKSELKRLTNQVKPFLFKPEDAELIINAPLYAETFLRDY